MNIKVIASSTSWIEGESLRQLEHTANMKGMVFVVGMPDLHPGKGTPVGAAFLSSGCIYPHLVGSDIGCGISLWQTDIPARKINAEKLAKKLKNSDLDYPYDGTPEWLEANELDSKFNQHAIGTIGSGNHFAELQKVHEVHNEEMFKSLGLDQSFALSVIHSGSRGLGEAILRAHTSVHGASPLYTKNNSEFDKYISRHDYAVEWSVINRRLIAHRFHEIIGAEGTQAIDLVHNSVTPQGTDWLHRKGAAPSVPGQAVLIPGSRGTLSYVVMPKGEQADNGWSVAHGAGRKWGRSDCKGKLSGRFSVDELKRNQYGGYIICEDKELLFEEAPQAYKNIDQVITDLTDAGLVDIVATLEPVLTYKTNGVK